MFIQFCDRSLVTGAMSLDLSVQAPAATLVSIPGVIWRGLYQNRLTADMNRNTTHHAVALTEL